jgi:hypothetical protein
MPYKTVTIVSGLQRGHDNVGAKNFYLKNEYKSKAIVFVKNPVSNKN